MKHKMIGTIVAILLVSLIDRENAKEARGMGS